MNEFKTDLAKKNKYDDLAAHALAGKSINIYLEPDATVLDRTTSKRYEETLDLRHIIVKDQTVWGCQDRNVSEFVDDTIAHTCGYGYTNALDMFINFRANDLQLENPRSKQHVLMMTTGRYAKLEWIIHDDFELLWEFGQSSDFSDVQQAIRHGKKFKIALMNSHGFWNIHPVYYPFYFPDENKLDFLTYNNNLPALIKTNPAEIVKFWEIKLGVLDSQSTDTRELSMEMENPSFWTCYKIYGDGIYQTIEDRKNNTAHKYQALKIFSSK